MKKNIILIDLNMTLLESIYESKKVNIEFLIIDADDSKLAEIKELYDIENIITRVELTRYVEQRSSNIDYEIIEKFKASQLNSERFDARFSSDANLIQYNYFNALSFWVDTFIKKNISTVLLVGKTHGSNFDGLILDVAKFSGASAYILDSNMRGYADSVSVDSYSVLNYNSNSFVPLVHNDLNLTPVDINNYLFYPDKINAIPRRKKIKSFLGLVNSFLPSWVYATLIAFQHMVYKSPYSHGLYYKPTNILKNILYIRRLKGFYNSISVKLNVSKKYIFYALHFDPEANTMSRTRLNNQLTIIRQLSQSIPKGWVLYIKEHPGQFKMSNTGAWYYLISIHKYRTKTFYREILKFDNVKFLKLDTKSQDVIKTAEGVSTIVGSVTPEALSLNKPLILFGHQATPFGLCKDVLKVTSSEQCRESMKKIESGLVPSYLDLKKIVDSYFFELKAELPSDVSLLVEYLVCKHSSDKFDI